MPASNSEMVEAQRRIQELESKVALLEYTQLQTAALMSRVTDNIEKLVGVVGDLAERTAGLGRY